MIQSYYQLILTQHYILMEILLERGAEIDYNDPLIPELPSMRMYDIHRTSVELTPENIRKYDCVLISTDHSVYDWDFIVQHARLVVDTRNATNAVKENREKIVKA